ncbi:hypothetical protein GTY65_17160 [Streptomyces sp. SID8379]|uniref:hypothetical protein n=1 Tax=unclassified Streptomyces TaxID=2593676 RepID=UPI0003609FBE|nr:MULTISPECIES: hypothetical protein [unclassified Streptomyces]MYW65770.1 hypothetical protein [Streptomyces sp. SID8379]
MNTHTATTLTRHLGRLLCWHLAAAMTLSAAYTLAHPHGHRVGLYLLWAALPLSSLAWALARACEKRHLRHDRERDTADPTDWTPIA